MIISGKAKLAGVVGWPVGHSKSPRLHGYWLDHFQIDGAYLPLPVAPENFTEAIRALVKLGFKGVNVTVPHKEAALAIADRVSDHAKRIGAANTLIFKEDGTIYADNSDGFGFMENLCHHQPNWQIKDEIAVILGAGGAARALLVALIDAGVGEIRLLNRTKARAEALASELGGPITVMDWESRDQALADAHLLVNSSSLGMSGQPALEINLKALPKDALVTDIVYAPLITDLLDQAQQRGNPIVDGLGMLLHQARPGFEAWFGQAPKVTAELRDFVLQSV